MKNKHTKEAAYWIEKLDLKPHPEGGHYREVFAGSDQIRADALPPGFTGPRKTYTSIYFLLESHQISRLHRLKSDELWNFYSGSPIRIHVIRPDGTHEERILGPDPENGEAFQYCVPSGCWFGSLVSEPQSYALAGCFVAPGFDFQDFELGSRESLIHTFPEHKTIIQKLTS
ncbi:cupin domain-containing protein [bacterium]|nr:cupin domain-containing protein [bacterium]